MQEILSYIGNWGKYQVYVFAICIFPMFMSGVITMLPTFTMAVPNTRCYVPGYDDVYNASYASPFDSGLAPYLFPSPPKVQSSGYTYCSYCPPNGTDRSNCTWDLAIPCRSYVYDKSQYESSVTELFDMVCDDGSWKYELLQSLFSVGVLIGSAAFGLIGDRFGRRVAFLWASLSQIVVLNVIPFCDIYWLYCFVQILAGGLQYATYLTAFIVVMELFGGLPKTVFGIWAHGLFSVGFWYVGPMAYLIRDWRYLQWSSSVLSLLYIPYYWIFPESVRWLVVNDKPLEAERIVLKAARWNGVVIPEDTLRRELTTKETLPRASVLELFGDRKMAVVTLIVLFTWVVDSLCYYGLSWNIAWLPGDTYVNFVLSGTTDLVSYIFCVPIMEVLGRRWTLTSFFVIGGSSLIASGFFKRHDYVILFTLLGRFTIAANFGITYVYTAEIFPTVVRNSASGFSSMVSRIGSISAPQIALLADYYYAWLPVVVYGSFGLLAAVADWFLPETKGKPMTETIREGIGFVQNEPLVGCRRILKEKSEIAIEKF